MDSEFIRDRISALRIQKGVSEYKMSLDLGHSKSYVQSISSGRALPSMPEFLYICDYFGISPKDFFDDGRQELLLLDELLQAASELDADDLRALIAVTDRLREKHVAQANPQRNAVSDS